MITYLYVTESCFSFMCELFKIYLHIPSQINHQFTIELLINCLI